MNYSVSASVLSADMLNLEKEIRKMETSGIDMLHFDVMDGVFVNNITYGLSILDAVNKCTDMPLDVHLMIVDPLRYAERFANSGADIITFWRFLPSSPVLSFRRARTDAGYCRIASCCKASAPVLWR